EVVGQARRQLPCLVTAGHQLGGDQCRHGGARLRSPTHLPGRQGSRAPTIVPCRRDTPMDVWRPLAIARQAPPPRPRPAVDPPRAPPPTDPDGPAEPPDSFDDAGESLTPALVRHPRDVP